MNQRYELPVLYFSVFLLILTPLILLKTGIDLFDEGYYLQGYVNSQPIFFQLSGFHFLIRALPFSEHILFLRGYRVVFLVLSALFFAKALHKKVFADKSYSLIAGYVLLGNFLTYIHLASTISYNTLSVIFLELLFSCYLFFRSERFSISKGFLFPLLTFGIVLGLQAFNKPTSAALLAVLFCVDQAVYRLPRWKDWIRVIFSVGLLSALVLLVLVAYSYGSNALEAIRTMQESENPGMEGYLSFRFLFDQLFINTVLQSKKFLLFTFAYLFVYLIAKRYNKVNHITVQVLFMLITLGVCYRYRNIYFGQPGAEYLFAFFLYFLVAWAIQHWQTGHNANNQIDWHLVIALFVLPFAGFWGSNNPPMLGIIHYMIFPLLLIIYLNRQLKLSFVYFLPLMLSGYTLYNFLWAPYYNPPVFQQRKIIAVRGVSMKVSDYVYNRATAFATVKNDIDTAVSLVPVGVPNGLLYVNSLTAYYTLYFNSPEYTRGYLESVKIKGLPANVQLLVYKDHGSIQIQSAFNQFIAYLTENQFEITLIKDTDEYQLYIVRRP